MYVFLLTKSFLLRLFYFYSITAASLIFNELFLLINYSGLILIYLLLAFLDAAEIFVYFLVIGDKLLVLS